MRRDVAGAVRNPDVEAYLANRDSIDERKRKVELKNLKM